MDLSMLNNKDYELYKKAEDEVSNEHPIKCVCGKLCTGLHERNCSAFRKSVERRYFKLWKKQNEGKAGVGYKTTMVDKI